MRAAGGGRSLAHSPRGPLLSQTFLSIMNASLPGQSGAAAAYGALAAAKQQAQAGDPAAAHSGNQAAAAVVASYTFAPSHEIRELILHVCANLIRTRAAHVRSGWRTFLGVYAAAAADADELLVSLAFSTVHDLLTNHLEPMAAAGAFPDVVRAMVAFGSNRHAMFALRAVDHCAALGAHLARGRVPLGDEAEAAQQAGEAGPAAAAEGGAAAGGGAGIDWYDLDGPENADVLDDVSDQHLRTQARQAAAAAPPAEEGAEPTEEELVDAALLATDGERGGRIRRFGDTHEHLQLWFPLLTGLANLVASDPRLAVRSRALSVLFALLRRYGPGFSGPLWSLVYTGVLLPIFDDVRHAVEAADEQDASCTVAWEEATAAARAAAAAAAASPTTVARRAAPAPASNPYATAALGSASSASAAAAFDVQPEGGQGGAGGGGADLEDSRHPPRYRLSDFTAAADGRGPPVPLPADSPSVVASSLWPAAAVPARAGGAAAAAAAAGGSVDHEWLRTTCLPALSSLVRLQVRARLPRRGGASRRSSHPSPSPPPLAGPLLHAPRAPPPDAARPRRVVRRPRHRGPGARRRPLAAPAALGGRPAPGRGRVGRRALLPRPTLRRVLARAAAAGARVPARAARRPARRGRRVRGLYRRVVGGQQQRRRRGSACRAAAAAACARPRISGRPAASRPRRC